MVDIWTNCGKRNESGIGPILACLADLIQNVLKNSIIDDDEDIIDDEDHNEK